MFDSLIRWNIFRLRLQVLPEDTLHPGVDLRLTLPTVGVLKHTLNRFLIGGDTPSKGNMRAFQKQSVWGI